MTFFAKAGTLSLTTSDSGTKSVTNLGFEPKVVLFMSAWEIATNGVHQLMLGVAYGTNSELCLSTGSREGFNQARGLLSTTYCIYMRESDAGSGGRYTLNSMSASNNGEFILNVTNAVGANTTVGYLALGGTECEVAVGTHTVPGSTGATTVSGLSFQPNALIALGTGTTAVGLYNNFMASYGFATGSADDVQVSGIVRDTDNTVKTSNASTNKVIRRANAFGGWDKHVSFTAFTSDGFTLNVDDADADTFLMAYIALSVPEAKSGSTTLQGSTGTWALNTVGFEPSAAIFAAAPNVVTTGTATDHVHLALGLADSASQFGCTFYSYDGGNEAQVLTYTDAVLKGIQRDSANTFSVESAVALDSFDADGMVLDQTDAAPAAGIVTYLAFGAGVTPVPVYLLDDTTTEGWGLLQIAGTPPATATGATGFRVEGVASAQYSRMAFGTVRAANTFGGTAQPSSGPDNTLKDCWRTDRPVNVDVAAGDWDFSLPVIAVTGEGADVRFRVRLWRSANADGSGATELTSGAVTTSSATDLQSEAAQTLTATITLGAVAFTGQYLFVQLAAETI